MKKSSTVIRVNPDAQVAGRQRLRPPSSLSSDPRGPTDPVRYELPFPPDAVFEQVDALFGALANETRLRLLLALHPCIEPPEVPEPTSRCAHELHDQHDLPARRELCVCDLAAVAGASQSMTSHQLHILRRARLVDFRRVGKHALYRLSDGPHAHLLAHLLLDALHYVRMATPTTPHSALGPSLRSAVGSRVGARE